MPKVAPIGPGRTGMDVHKAITQKRRHVSLINLKRRMKAGEVIRPGTRAYYRLSQSATEVLLGMDDLSDWDDEELRNGCRRDKNGNFTGKPEVVPRKLHDEMVRRTLAKANELMRENLVAAVEVLTEIVLSPNSEDKDRLKAIDMMMNRVMGKEPQQIEIKGEQKWELALATSIVSMPDALDTSPKEGEEEELEEEDEGDDG